MSQLSKTSFGNLYGTPSGTTFPDNTTGDISEGDMRQFGKDILDSAMFLTDNFIDEDSFASDSPTKVPSQQSVKAFVEAQVAGGDVRNTTVSLSSAELLNIFSAPKELIAAPGANMMIQVLSIVAHYKYGTAAYSSSTNFAFKYDNASGAGVNASSLTMLDGSADTVIVPALATYTNDIPASTIVNKNVIFTNTSANPTLGDGTLKVFLTYKILNVS